MNLDIGRSRFEMAWQSGEYARRLADIMINIAHYRRIADTELCLDRTARALGIASNFLRASRARYLLEPMMFFLSEA